MHVEYQTVTEEWANTAGNCNTNNHGECDNYREIYNLTNKNNWVKSFPDPEGSFIIPITVDHCKILVETGKVGFLNRRRPKIYDDELNDFEQYLSKYFKNGNWFIRLNEASPKDGIYGAGPLTSTREITDSLITSKRAYRALLNGLESGKGDILYVVPFRFDWNEELEFRCFVYNKNTTAVSQYIWYRDCHLKNKIKDIVPNIIKYLQENVIYKFNQSSFVADVIATTQNNIELIEINSFGKELASGSALFHWLNDSDILYNNNNTITVRYIKN